MARGRARAAVDAAARPSPEASDSDLGGYEAVPYESAPISVSAPARLAALAWLKGLTPHPIDRAQVLEIGCGDGANLIPLAYHHPHAQFLGFDRSQSAIDEARHAATRLRLENLGDKSFLEEHGIQYAYASGSMANGIASEELVEAMSRTSTRSVRDEPTRRISPS